jgi:hypothetical protein
MRIRVGASLPKNLAISLRRIWRRNRLLTLLNPMNLKDMLGRIKTDPDNRHSDGSFGCVVYDFTAWHTPQQE